MGAEIRFTKWGGKRHWRYPMESLATDRYGWWLGGRAGILVQRGLEDPIVQAHDFVVLVPPRECWIASWNGPGETDISVYVDVTTQPVREAEVVHAVDLDLDGIRLRDGSVRVLDEDEFADHQVRYSYPNDVIRQAKATADELVDWISGAREPFGAVGAARLATFIGQQ